MNLWNEFMKCDSISLDCWNPKGDIRDKGRKVTLNSDINILSYSLKDLLKDIRLLGELILRCNDSCSCLVDSAK